MSLRRAEIKNVGRGVAGVHRIRERFLRDREIHLSEPRGHSWLTDTEVCSRLEKLLAATVQLADVW